ncbi:MAG: hypothetical protein HY209_02970 [Candidatus Omnitrophica bacterium]|nr:hypothetical protein [Candidatus Omnitrophota bacterium]
MVKGRRQQGVTSLAEYTMTFFLVIAVVVAMTTYIQRSLQARIRDARHYMIAAVSNQCDANCMNATGLAGSNTIGEQYEPYYAAVNATVSADSLVRKGLLAPGVGSTGIFRAQTNEQNQSASDSNQLPPVNAANDKVLGAQ